MLDNIATYIEYTLIEIDIRSNPVLFEEYRYRIPVIIIAATTLLEGRIEYNALARAFDMHAEKG